MGARRIIFGVAVLLCGCGSREQDERAPARTPDAVPPAAARPDDRPLIVAFGDSLTAGHGPAAERSYPWFLQQQLDARGLRYRVADAGVGGDTTSGGLARAGSIIAMKPRIVIVEFGGNDGLRGLPAASIRANLEQIILRLKQAGIQTVLAGMTLPPNYGPEYIREFERMYKDLAASYNLPLIPFLLEGVGGDARYMQPDGIHPNVEGNRRVAENVMRVLEPLLSG